MDEKHWKQIRSSSLPCRPTSTPPPTPKNSCNGYVDEDVGEWVGGRQEARKDLPSLRRSASFKASLRDKGVRSSPMPLSGTPLPAAVVSTACTALGQPGKASAADARPRPPTHLERRVRRVEGGEEEEEEEEEEEVEARRVRTLVMLRRAGKEKALTRRMLRVTSSSRTSLVMVVPAGRICYVVVWWGGICVGFWGGRLVDRGTKRGALCTGPGPLQPLPRPVRGQGDGAFVHGWMQGLVIVCVPHLLTPPCATSMIADEFARCESKGAASFFHWESLAHNDECQAKRRRDYLPGGGCLPLFLFSSPPTLSFVCC